VTSVKALAWFLFGGTTMSEREPGILILCCGLPGAGKTTLAKQLETERHAIRLSPDEWKVRLGFDLFDERARERVEALQWQFASNLLGLGQTVILENGFWPKIERAEIRQKAAALGVETEMHYLDAPFKKLLRRIAIRNKSNDPYTVPLTEDHMKEYLSLFEPPDDDELKLYTRSFVHK
jgi:predicted kinase